MILMGFRIKINNIIKEINDNKGNNFKITKALTALFGTLSNNDIVKYSLLAENDIENLKLAIQNDPEKSDPEKCRRFNKINSFCESYSANYTPEPGTALAIGVNTTGNKEEGKIVEVVIKKKYEVSKTNSRIDDIFNSVRTVIKNYINKIIDMDKNPLSEILKKEFEAFDSDIKCIAENYNDKCDGDSLMVPMAIAYVSYFLNNPKTEKFNNIIFTGAISDDGSIAAGSLEEKAKYISEEIPWCKKFICPENMKNKIDSLQIETFNSLESIFKSFKIGKNDFLMPLRQKIIINSKEHSVHEKKSTASALISAYDIIEKLSINEIRKNKLEEIITGYLKHLNSFKYLDRAITLFEEYYINENLFKDTGIDMRLYTFDYAARSYREFLLFDEANELFESIIKFFESGIKLPERFKNKNWPINNEKLYENTLGAYFRSLFEQYFLSSSKNEVFFKMTEIIKKRANEPDIEKALFLLKNSENKFSKKMELYYAYIQNINEQLIEKIISLLESDILNNEKSPEGNHKNSGTENSSNDKINLYFLSAGYKNQILTSENIKKVISKIQPASHYNENLSIGCIYYNAALLSLKNKDYEMARKLSILCKNKLNNFSASLTKKMAELEKNEPKFINKLGVSLIDIFIYFCSVIEFICDDDMAIPVRPDIKVKSSPYVSTIDEIDRVCQSLKNFDHKKAADCLKPLFLY